MNNSQNTPQQLSQEQIDSLNALYAKMGDSSIDLEFYTQHDELGWIKYSGNPNTDDIRVVLSGAYQYRIKPQPKMKTVIQVKETQLPLTSSCNLMKRSKTVRLEVFCDSEGDAESWYYSLSSMMKNTIQVEE